MENVSCIICQDFLVANDSNGEAISAIKCGHVFHKECLDQWFSADKPKECPICRLPVVDDDILNKLYFSSDDYLDCYVKPDKVKDEDKPWYEKYTGEMVAAAGGVIIGGLLTLGAVALGGNKRNKK